MTHGIHAGDACQSIAALGVAGAWRMGKWSLLKRYLEMATARSTTKQILRYPWDVCVGSLLKAVHERSANFSFQLCYGRQLAITNASDVSTSMCARHLLGCFHVRWLVVVFSVEFLAQRFL